MRPASATPSPPGSSLSLRRALRGRSRKPGNRRHGVHRGAPLRLGQLLESGANTFATLLPERAEVGVALLEAAALLNHQRGALVAEQSDGHPDAKGVADGRIE